MPFSTETSYSITQALPTLEATKPTERRGLRRYAAAVLGGLAFFAAGAVSSNLLSEGMKPQEITGMISMPSPDQTGRPNFSVMPVGLGLGETPLNTETTINATETPVVLPDAPSNSGGR